MDFTSCCLIFVICSVGLHIWRPPGRFWLDGTLWKTFTLWIAGFIKKQKQIRIYKKIRNSAGFKFPFEEFFKIHWTFYFSMKWILKANFSSFVPSGHDHGQVQWLCPRRIILGKWLFGFLTIEDTNRDRLQWLIIWSSLEKWYTCSDCHWSSKMGCVVSIRSWLHIRSSRSNKTFV